MDEAGSSGLHDLGDVEGVGILLEADSFAAGVVIGDAPDVSGLSVLRFAGGFESAAVADQCDDGVTCVDEFFDVNGEAISIIDTAGKDA